eukprot:CAMPEP_0171096970 /NCGR_PEP_ID=MMETSP0766_2-20121228/46468_1 /TAXON_ID=439317 /ORGANISM="Gambierdiscus australes, Strain CAWD 149" /LENGTH=249 /DNA_ID=CAMNT_0011556067 /DNA_START=45 /DNA_END=794 /DNA_ORIENTATION=+
MSARPYIFAAESAKSGKATCKMCKGKIEQGKLRVGVITIGPEMFGYSDHMKKKFAGQSGPVCLTNAADMDECDNMFDQMGWLWRWYCVDCFQFNKYPALKNMSCFCSKMPIASLSAADRKYLEGKISGTGGKGDGGGASAKAKAKAKGKAKAEAAAPKAKAEAKAGGKRKAGAMLDLSGKTIMFTGTLTMKRAEAEGLAKAAGAIIGTAVSKNTDILVCGPGAGSKLAKAQSLGITTWDEAEFKSKVGM